MKLRYILGTPGSGKTNLCIKEIMQTQEKTKNTLFYIVPEQFSLQAEKNLVNSSENKILLQTQVLSFKRLAFHIISETGALNLKILENIGQTILLKKIIIENKTNLLFYANSVNKDGFLEKLDNTINDFFQYCITPEILQDSIEKIKDNENLYLKLSDLYLIYKKYLEFLHQEYISTNETLDILAERISQSNIIKNSEIWIDGFDAFTPQQYKVIEKLILCTSIVNIVLCVNSNNTYYKNLSPFNDFYETKETINKLNDIALKNNIQIENKIFLNTNYRAASHYELLHLDKYYFSYTVPPFNGLNKRINIICEKNKYDEITSTAKSIIKIIQKHKIKFNEIAVISSTEDYNNPIKHIFHQFNIPFFMDVKKNISLHPLTELISSALDIIISNWSYESVFRFLKCGLVPISDDDIYEFENYVLAYGIKGYYYKLKHWSFGFNFSKTFNEDDINYIKDCVTDLLSPLSELNNSDDYTVNDISIKIFNFLEYLNITDMLDDWVNAAKNRNDYQAANEHSQIWNIVVNIFEKLVEIIGNENISISEYAKILNTSFSSSTMGLIPATLDQVIIGDIKRTKLNNIKALFVLGVNEGILPSFKDDSDTFSDSEKDYLKEIGLEITGNTNLKINNENYLIYTTLTKASEFLFLCYSTGELNGMSKRPSPIILKIKNMFPDIKEISFNDEYNSINNISVPYNVFENFFKLNKNMYENVNPIYKDLYSWFSRHRPFDTKLHSIKEGLNKNIPLNYITDENTDKLYGDIIFTSVSKLEQFSRCPFSFFIKYGLKINERKEYKISSPDLGNLFHGVFETFSENLKENDLNWNNIDKETIKKITDKSVDELVPTIGSEILLSSARYKYLINRIKRIASRSIWAISEHLKSGSFTPLGYEIGFGINEKLPPIIIELNNDKKIILTGKIDRVDTLQNDNECYIKIIDYKSYDKNYDLSDIYYGMQLQLMVYLDTFIKQGKLILDKELLPGGIFYFKINDPIIKSNKNITAETIEKEILKTFSVNGLILDNINVIKGLTCESEKLLSETDTKKLIKNNINIKSSSVMIDSENLNTLRNYTNDMVKDICTKIMHGNIQIEPYKKRIGVKEKTGCDYCPYSSICSIETLEKDNKYRIIKKIANPLDEIKKSSNNDEN